MAQAVVVGTLAGLVGGIIGALVTLVVQPARVVQPEAAAAEETDASAEDGAPSDEGMARRLESLERRLSLLTLAAARANGEAAEAAPADGATPPSQADVADPVFEAAVLDILD